MNNSDHFELPEEISFSYGYGRYEQGAVSFWGGIVLGQHKLFLKGESGEIPQTYIPLEKIYKVKRFWFGGLAVYVKPSQMTECVAKIFGERPLERDLLRDLVRRRGLKKKVWTFEWIDSNF